MDTEINHHLDRQDQGRKALWHLRRAYDAVVTAGATLDEASPHMNVRQATEALDFHVLLPLVHEAMTAAEMLAEGVPLGDRFPDGKPAPERLSPRQVFFLADLFDRELEVWANPGPAPVRTDPDPASPQAFESEGQQRRRQAEGVPCPECGHLFFPRGLELHRQRKHGVGKAER